MAGGRAHYAGPRRRIERRPDRPEEPRDRPTADLRVPADGERWRCAGCGNLTRFDVTRTRRTTDYWHFDLAGEHRVEEETVLARVRGVRRRAGGAAGRTRSRSCDRGGRRHAAG